VHPRQVKAQRKTPVLTDSNRSKVP
jgi:hypothetical protein